MKIISHRGNLHGPGSVLENSTASIKTALSRGFNCEVDIQWMDGEPLLGHDTSSPVSRTTLEFLRTPGLWLHAKDIEVFMWAKDLGLKNVFWQETDAVAPLPYGRFWLHEKHWHLSADQPQRFIVCALGLFPALPPWWKKLHGVCTDNPVLLEEYRGGKHTNKIILGTTP